MKIIKPTSSLISLTTANTINNATLVYIAALANCVITSAYANGTTIGTFVIPQTQSVFVEKSSTDTLASNVAVSATAVAYKN